MDRFVFSVISLLCVTFIVLGCGCKKDEAPMKSFRSFNTALKQKNWEEVWDLLSLKSKKAFAEEGYKRMKEIIESMPPEMRKKKVDSLDVTHAQLLDMEPKQFFLYVMKKTESSQDFFSEELDPEISKTIINGDKAVLYIKGKNEYVNMVLENGVWKIEFEEE